MGNGEKRPTNPLGVPVPPGPKGKEEEEANAKKGSGVPGGPKQNIG